MNSMQAVLKMLAGEVVYNRSGSWYAKITNGKLFIGSFANNQKEWCEPIFDGSFICNTNNDSWEVYKAPPKLFQKDLKNLEKFNYVEHKGRDKFVDYVYIVVDRGSQVVNLITGDVYERSLCNDLEVYRVT